MKSLAAPHVQATPVLMRQCGTQRMGTLSRRLMKQTPDAIVEHVKRLLSESGFQTSVARRSASQVLPALRLLSLPTPDTLPPIGAQLSDRCPVHQT